MKKLIKGILLLLSLILTLGVTSYESAFEGRFAE